MTDIEIEGIVRAFEDTSLPRPDWNHARHLVVALWYIIGHGRDGAAVRMRDGILRYIGRHGSRTGYHETITRAWFAVLERFLAGRDRGRPIAALARELLDECGDKDYLLRFYSRERLFSDEARAGWVPPDLAEIR